jgi:hypothetical protein
MTGACPNSFVIPSKTRALGLPDHLTHSICHLRQCRRQRPRPALLLGPKLLRFVQHTACVVHNLPREAQQFTILLLVSRLTLAALVPCRERYHEDSFVELRVRSRTLSIPLARMLLNLLHVADQHAGAIAQLGCWVLRGRAHPYRVALHRALSCPSWTRYRCGSAIISPRIHGCHKALTASSTTPSHNIRCDCLRLTMPKNMGIPKQDQ